MMRVAILALALVLLIAPRAGHTQPATKVWRIGVLTALSAESSDWASFREGLRELGYVEGQNTTFKGQSTGGRAERLPDLVAELVRLPVDVIVAVDNPSIAAAQRATGTIPIVMVLPQDPVRSGFARSLARPGANITGLTTQAPELSGKVLQLLKEAVPTASRLAVLWDPTEPGRRESAQEAERAGHALRLHVRLLEARGPYELESVFTAMVREGVDVVHVQASQMISVHRARIATLAVKNRFPTVSTARWYAEAGGLMSYGISYNAQFRRAAYYVDKLLGGVKAADLPIEQPTKFELVINLKTAQSLGLTIQQSVLFRADELLR